MWTVKQANGAKPTLSAPRFGRRPIKQRMTLAALLRRAAANVAALFTRAVDSIMAARMRRIASEAGLHRKLCQPTAGENDVLPDVRKRRQAP